MGSTELAEAESSTGGGKTPVSGDSGGGKVPPSAVPSSRSGVGSTELAEAESSPGGGEGSLCPATGFLLLSSSFFSSAISFFALTFFSERNE